MARLARKARWLGDQIGWKVRLVEKPDWLESQVGLEARLARLAGKAKWVGLGGKIGWEA